MSKHSQKRGLVRECDFCLHKVFARNLSRTGKICRKKGEREERNLASRERQRGPVPPKAATSQSRTVKSSTPPLARVLPSGAKMTGSTGPAWPRSTVNER